MPATDQTPLVVVLVRTEPRAVDPVALAALSAGERERAARFRRPEDAARFVTARTVARRLLAERLGVPPSAVDLVVPQRNRKPRVPGSTLDLSISHSGDVVLVAMADGVEVGIDVEGGPMMTGGLEESTWRQVTSAAERAATGPLEWPADGPPNATTADAFLRLWTRKEAVLKSVGLGLSVPLAELTIRDDDPPSIAATPETLPRPDELALLDLPAPRGTRIALAAVTRRPIVVREAGTGEILGSRRCS